MGRVTGAQYLARAMDDAGVTNVFLVPTVLSATLVAIEEETSIRRVVTHGEKAAAYMADGYARASGKPGVAVTKQRVGIRKRLLDGAAVGTIDGSNHRAIIRRPNLKRIV